jgi:hypothetical protein
MGLGRGSGSISDYRTYHALKHGRLVQTVQAFSVYDLKVDKTPPDTMVDQVVMLLSTDWFLPYWSVMGIDASEQRVCIQKGCRQIVREVMNGATIYYHINFSDERLQATRQGIRDLARKCRLGESSEMNLEDLVDSRPAREQFYKGAWLFKTLANHLANDDQLDATTKLVLQRTRRQHAVMDDLDFAQLCSRSNSTWDNYTRSLTPELPTSLADFLSEDLVANQLLTSVLAQLTQAQKDGLLSRFQSIAKSVTGVDVDRTWRPV